MYQEFFGLRHEPFSIAPDPRYLFMSDRHREALAHLLYGVNGGGGFVLLTGEIGAGKTTLCRWFVEQVPERCHVAYVFNPALTVVELLQTVCDEFHIDVKPRDPGVPTTVKDHVDALNRFLLDAHAQDRNCLLIIDEAQSLSTEVLEQLRLLTNLETAQRKLLQIMLIGQPELRGILAQPRLEQLAQRVIARYHLEALTEAETRSYLRRRLTVAGARGTNPFSREAMRRIHTLSRGVPRRINLIADRALLGAYAKGRRAISAKVVDQAAVEVLGASGGPAKPPGRMQEGLSALKTLRSSPRLQWAAGLGALGGVALLAALLWGWQTWRASKTPAPALGTTANAAALAGKAPGRPVNAASVPSPAPVLPVVAVAASAAKAAPGPAPTSPAAPSTVPPSPASAPASAPTIAGPTLDAAAAKRLSALPSSEAKAMTELASAWGVFVASGEPCAVALRAEVRCFRGKGQVATLRQLGRPAVLTLRDDAGRSVYAPLMQLKGDTATVRVGGAVQQWPWPVLERRWRGEFATMWRTPPGYQPNATITASDDTGRWAATHLAQRPGAPASEPLRSQIVAFQSAQGLPTTGRLGPLTLMQLNRIAGVNEPSLSASP